MDKTADTLRTGYYETEYGNTAILTSPTARTAKDIDSGERVPVVMLAKWLRPLTTKEK